MPRFNKTKILLITLIVVVVSIFSLHIYSPNAVPILKNSLSFYFFGEELYGGYPGYDYCKPDKDLAFKLSREDDGFFYYKGEKVIVGRIFQESKDGPIMFFIPRDQGCRFELTKNFDGRYLEAVRKDFRVKQAWRRGAICDLIEGNREKPFLSGVYALKIRGFKIPKKYIEQYSDNVNLSRYDDLLKYFSVDYEEIQATLYRSEVVCPEILVD